LKRLSGSVTVPPIDGSAIVHVRSCADPALVESGSISGSSWPVQLDVY
jgi:hypothetical protein